jgi:hypothetical protein
MRTAPHRVVLAVTDGMPIFEASVPCEVFGIDRPDLASPWYSFCVVGLGDAPLSLGPGFWLSPTDDAGALARMSAEQALREAHHGTFGPLFWFLVLPGPLGLVLYPLATAAPAEPGRPTRPCALDARRRTTCRYPAIRSTGRALRRRRGRHHSRPSRASTLACTSSASTTAPP